MANLTKYSLNRLNEDFNEAYNEGRLQKYYFVHRYNKRNNHPYDINSSIKQDKQNLLNKMRNSIKEQDFKEKKDWDKRKTKQKATMKVLINILSQTSNKKIENYNSDDETLVKNLNILYYNYIKSETSLYNSEGYLDVYRQRAIKEELHKLYETLLKNDKIENGKEAQGTNFQELIVNELNNQINKFSKDFLEYLKNRRLQIEEQEQNILKSSTMNNKSKKAALTSCADRKNLIAKLIVEAKKSNDSNLFVTNIVIESEKYNFKNIRAQEAGNKNELIVTEILEKLFDTLPKDVVTNEKAVIIKQTGTGQITTGKYQSTIKTDLRISFLESYLNNLGILAIEEKKSFDYKNGYTNINFSLKNYNPKNDYDIGAQSNNNFTSFLNILNKRNEKRNGSALSFIKDKTLSNLQYFLLNDNVKGRPNNFITEFKTVCSELGLEVLLALKDEEDEIDFLEVNQCIIPSYYLREKIEDYKRKNGKGVFSVHIKSPIPSADTKEIHNLNDSNEHYYQEEYLKNFISYGQEQYNNLYINTKINKNFVFDIINEIRSNIKTGGK